MTPIDHLHRRPAQATSRADGPADVEHVLTLDCDESPGIVHAVSGFLVEQNCDIIDNQQFGDRINGRFYMRVHMASAKDARPAGTEDLREAFAPVAEQFGMRWQLEPAGAKRRILIMVSRYGHCLNDLLYEATTGALPVEIAGVVSNHRDHASLVEWHRIPFFHIPVTRDTKPEAEARLVEVLDELDIELVVLARYMQVLSDELSTRLSGKCINIHHSFLPSFKGAKPYHQAYQRGVKTVGATAHYVDSELDEGPIISQQVVEVDHTYGPDDLAAAGRDTECKALSNAVKWHCEGRVILAGGKTVVLR
ncbi:formyltetrahydrofolate deformylase [Arthrobacter castelli]|uniref:formyltetrahydrofolate deformylase n=1 Tax=Arthrobacter castelli TaxID=271431 RepID=UPI0003FD1FCB|nr:formyltetrahydrofolate deformylase [Arthrobacter castelli]